MPTRGIDGDDDTVALQESSDDVVGPTSPSHPSSGDEDPIHRRASDAPSRTPTGLRMLGRYVVQGDLGSGGMGTVLKGFDPQLDRRVALKVLHDEVDDEHAARLLREAHAMAKLSHPNVVQIFEVGTFDGQTFVAMELVKGQTLRSWMEQQPRPGWRQCVSTFLQAGEGLAAAHEEGLVHRDFKPSNAMIDDKGRVRVLDFGLARPVEPADRGQATASPAEPVLDDHSPPVEADPGLLPTLAPSSTSTTSSAASSSPLHATITRTGIMLGTPAYMPPEQLLGHETNARGDQFSFCIALWEALHGERPFAGSTVTEVRRAIVRGTIRPAPPTSTVPRALHHALLRGLANDPRQRWPSMSALLTELRRVLAPRRWLRLVVAGTLGLVTIGALVAPQLTTMMQRCTGARARLDGVWDETRREEAEAAIIGTELSYAAGTWQRVEPLLDQYADDWVDAHTDTCEATAVRHEQSEEHRDLRMVCLHQRRLHLRATVRELMQANETVVENAMDAVTGLPSLERCADVEALSATIPPPDDPAVAEQAEALEERLTEVKAKARTGQYGEALVLVEAIATEAEALGYEPLIGRVLLRRSLLQERTGDYDGSTETLMRAYDIAVVQRMAPQAAEAASAIVWVLGYQLDRHDDARVWARHADPLSRAVGTDEARANYLVKLGSLAQAEGRYDEAHESFQQALERLERSHGTDSLRVANVLINLGNVAQEQRALDEAREFYERALAIQEQMKGPTHPKVALSLMGLGGVAALRRRHEEAQASYERALAIYDQTLGSDHPQVAKLSSNLCVVQRLQGRLEQAQASCKRARDIFERTLGPDHPSMAGVLNALGDVLRQQGRLAEARASYQRALTIRENALGPEHPKVLPSLLKLATVAKSRGEYEDARALYERGVAIREATLGADHPKVANVQLRLGETWLELSRPERALGVLERVMATQLAHELEPVELSRGRFALARALWSAPSAGDRDKTRARALAEQARDALAAVEASLRPDAVALEDIEAWLDEHSAP